MSDKINLDIDIKIYTISYKKKGMFNKLVIGNKVIYFQFINNKLVEKDLTKENIELIKASLNYKKIQYDKVYKLLKDKYNLALDIGSIQEIEDSLKKVINIDGSKK